MLYSVRDQLKQNAVKDSVIDANLVTYFLLKLLVWTNLSISFKFNLDFYLVLIHLDLKLF